MIKEIASNPVFVGMVGAGVVGAIGYTSKSLLVWGWEKFKRSITSSVTLNSRDCDLFFDMCQYINSCSAFKSIKTLLIEDERGYLPHDEIRKTTMLPAPGFYWGISEFRVMFLDIANEKNDNGGATTTLKLGALCLKKGFLENKIKEIIARRKGENLVKIRIGQDATLKREKRSLDSVFIENGIKEDAVARIQDFLDNKERYKKMGLPYTLNFLFSGPPGTGKTSLIFALASHFGFEIRTVPTLKEEGFTSFVSEAPPGTMIILEDCDVSDIAVNREDDKGINLSVLLNSLDGLRAPEGCIMILTTNHPEKLDPALVRAGRIDKVYELGYFSPEFSKEIACKMGRDDVDFEGRVVPAELIQKLKL